MSTASSPVIRELAFLLHDLKPDIVALNGKKGRACHGTFTALAEEGLFQSGELLRFEYVGQWNETSSKALYYFPRQDFHVLLHGYVGSCEGCLGLETLHDIYEMFYEQVSRAEIRREAREVLLSEFSVLPLADD